jgi:ribosomal protein L37AE/L43A
MKTLGCPKCQEQSLVPTGGFWRCGACRYAITHAALLVETKHEGTAGYKPYSPERQVLTKSSL